MTQTIEIKPERKTKSGDPYGYIQPKALRELWFHTGTACNLSCAFCLEGSKPGDTRIQFLTFEEGKRFIDEALPMGVEQFSFTGGEPFVNHDFVKILDYALNFKPCLILTNGTAPIRKKMPQVLELKKKKFQPKFRVSLDSPDPEKHDKYRGQGNFKLALDTLGKLHKEGFHISIARQEEKDEEDREAVNKLYQKHFAEAGLPNKIPFVVFPELSALGSIPNVPEVTEHCMTAYQTEKSRSEFMCSYSKMVVKKEGQIGVYACTLVDDDSNYDLGPTLTEAMKPRVTLQHHRCYSCFAYGTSCSEAK